MFRLFSILVVAIFSNPLSWTITKAYAAKNKIILTGSSTVAPLVSEIAKRFEIQHPGIRVDVQSGGSSRGIADAKQGLSDIGMISRELKNEEKELFAFTIAKDGICIIVHKNNPVSTLTDPQIIDIYTGKISNWKQVGGKDAPITVVSKAEGRSTLELFLNHFKLKTTEIKSQVIIGDNPQGIKTVAGNPNSIGYVSIGSAEYDFENGVPIKLLPVSGIIANRKNVKNGSFPLSRPLNLVTKIKPTGLIKEFINFSSSKDVNDIIKEQYFVPVAE